jgi:hypothetical protein
MGDQADDYKALVEATTPLPIIDVPKKWHDVARKVGYACLY